MTCQNNPQVREGWQGKYPLGQPTAINPLTPAAPAASGYTSEGNGTEWYRGPGWKEALDTETHGNRRQGGRSNSDRHKRRTPRRLRPFSSGTADPKTA